MAKILVCLLSDQAIPNLATIIHYGPDKIIFLESASAKEKNWAGQILKSLALRKLVFSDENILSISVKDQNSILELQNALSDCTKFISPVDKVTVNITGGTKPMSIGAYNYFSSRNTEIVYLFKDNLLNARTDEKSLLNVNPALTCDEYLIALGFAVENGASEIPEEDKAFKNVIRTIAKNFISDEMLDYKNDSIANLTISEEEKNIEAGKNRDKIRKKKKGGVIGVDFKWKHWVSPDIKNVLNPFFIDGKVPDSWLNLLEGEWLEVFVKDVLVRHSKQLKIHDIHKGKVVVKEVPNELDVVFMKGIELNIVECKTGSQEHGSWTDVFYKIEAVKKQFGSLRIKSYVVSTSKNILDAKGNIKEAVLARANFYNCTILPAKMIKELAEASSEEKEYEILKQYI